MATTRSSGSVHHAHVDTPLGTVLLCADATCLTGLYFVDQLDCPKVGETNDAIPLPRKPSDGMHHGRAIRLLRIRQTANLPLFDDEGVAPAAQASRERPIFNTQGADLLLGPLTPLDEEMPAAALAILQLARDELQAYFQGKLKVFSVPVHASGSVFQQAVWRALIEIPYGRHVSYGDIAKQLERPASHARAIGTAVGANPVSIIIPCHRVVSGTKAMTGYSGGLSRKLALLEIEGMTIA